LSQALPLFVYGTLRDPDLLAAILNRPLPADAALAAVAPGFAALHYPGRPYPALVRKPGGAAAGLALLGLSPFERDLLDRFEGAEYVRGVLAVLLGEELHEAEAYLPAVTVPATSPPWSLAGWQARHKPHVLAGEIATAQALRARLLAVRPH
jgi:gamma-glutamylcyclotransferase (GGCT)/AIG2-like uncharacterized protein YtfP